MPAPARTVTVRHVQLLRALFAALAAIMIAFSPDHSAGVGLAVFGGFAVATGIVLAVGAWIVLPAGSRWSYVVPALLALLAGMVSGIPAWRTDALFFTVVIVWAAASGLVELIAGLRARRSDPAAADAIRAGVLALLLAAILLLIPVDYASGYSIDGAGDFTLTGIILGVGVFGGYAAIVAVLLGIAGLSPRGSVSREPSQAIAHAERTANADRNANADRTANADEEETA